MFLFHQIFSPFKEARHDFFLAHFRLRGLREIICGHKHRERTLPRCEGQAQHRGMWDAALCLPPGAGERHDACPRNGGQLRQRHGPCASHVTQLVDGGGGNCGVTPSQAKHGENRLVIASCHHVPLLRSSSQCLRWCTTTTNPKPTQPIFASQNKEAK